MNGLLTHSNLSFASSQSSRPPSIQSFATNTESSETGIGSLSGRGVYAVGEAALRGIRKIENFAIRRKLRVINSVFPDDGTIATKNIEALYDDVLELSRFRLYEPPVRKQALRVLLIQIATRQTRYLVQRVVKWPAIEIALFLSEILACMPANWLPPTAVPNDMHRELMVVYFTFQRPGTYHSASPLVDFVVDLAQVSSSTSRAVLASGFLDMLLCMYACNFTGNKHTTGPHGVGDVRAMSGAASAVLVTLCRRSDALQIISAHPIATLWPRNEPLRSMLGNRTAERQGKWRQLGPDIAARRLSSLPDLLRLPVIRINSALAELTDVCIDLLEFSRERYYGPKIARDALALIHHCIGLCGAHWDALSKAFSYMPPAETQDISNRLHVSLKATGWHLSLQAAEMFRASHLSFERSVLAGSPSVACVLPMLKKVTFDDTDPRVIQEFFRSSRTPALECVEIVNKLYEPDGMDVSLPVLPALTKIVFDGIRPLHIQQFFRSSPLPSLDLVEIRNLFQNDIEDIFLPRLSSLRLAGIDTGWQHVDILRLLHDCDNLYINCVASFDHSVLFAMSTRIADDDWICPNLASLEIHEHHRVRLTPDHFRRMITARQNASLEATSHVTAIKRLVVHSPRVIAQEDRDWFNQNMQSFQWDDNMIEARW